MPEVEIAVRVNGTSRRARVEPRLTLADFLRDVCHLTGTHLGCEHGVCGACTVLLDDAAVRSCLIFAVQADGAEVTTVEGMGTPDKLSPVQAAFHSHYAAQCGFCTPGMVLAATALIERKGGPVERGEVLEALGGHYCRCTGYVKIVDAVMAASRGETGAREDEPETGEEEPVMIPGSPA